MIPAPFRSLRSLRALNVAAVGISLAAVVSAVAVGLLDTVSAAAAATGLPTLVLGTLWATLLRSPKTVGRSSFRWGWVASVPLAALNGGLACGFTFASMQSHVDFVFGVLAGMTFGIVAWLPALLLTLLCFGLPIASAQRRAAEGLAGEEHGELTVGFACSVMSAFALAIASLMPHFRSSAGLPLVFALAILGLLTGGTAAVLAHAREGRRRKFVARAEAGEIPGYRVDPTQEGKVLVRIVSQGEGYRVADFEEEVFDLGAQGEATRARLVAPTPRP